MLPNLFSLLSFHLYGTRNIFRMYVLYMSYNVSRRLEFSSKTGHLLPRLYRLPYLQHYISLLKSINAVLSACAYLLSFLRGLAYTQTSFQMCLFINQTLKYTIAKAANTPKRLLGFTLLVPELVLAPVTPPCPAAAPPSPPLLVVAEFS